MKFHGRVRASFDELRSSTMHFCRNDICCALSFERFTPPDGKGHSLRSIVRFPGPSEELNGRVDGGDPRMTCSAMFEPAGPGEFFIEARLDGPWASSELSDGDILSVAIRTGAQRNLVTLRQAVTYTESSSGTPECPHVCRGALLKQEAPVDGGLRRQ